MNVNQYGRIECNYPQLYYQGEFYLDWSSFVELTGQPSTNLFRLIKSLNNVPTFKYKNRVFYEIKFCLGFFKYVDQQNKANQNSKGLP